MRFFSSKVPKRPYKEINDFLLKNTHNKEVVLNTDMRIQLKDFIVDFVKTLVDSEYTTKKIPSYWSDLEMVQNACHIRDYQGLLILGSRNENFDNNYAVFMEPYKAHIQKSIVEGNLFIAYVHVVKLFREITLLNKMASKELASKPDRHSLLRNSFNELNETITKLISVQNEEAKFWSIALTALGLHALASVHYNEGSFELYNLSKAKSLLRTVLKLCEEGETAVEHIKNQSTVDFYTLNTSLIKTLPYPSFAKQRNDILDLALWLPDELSLLQLPL